MTACISPGMTSSVTSSVTARLPKFLRKPSSRSTGSGMTGPPPNPRGEAEQAAAGEQHDQDENRPENHFPVFGYSRQPLFREQKGDAADQRAVERADAAEDHHDDQLAGFLPRHVSR